MSKKNQKPVKKEKTSPIKSGFMKFGYAVSIVEIWIAALAVALVDLAFLFCGFAGIIGGISLFVRHMPLQGWLYVGIGLVAAGLVIPVFLAVKKVFESAVAITKMQGAKLNGKTEEEKK